jgi:hypothetical protein
MPPLAAWQRELKVRGRLQDPYALNQPLLPTEGCVRMKNRDINSLIQLSQRLASKGIPGIHLHG